MARVTIYHYRHRGLGLLLHQPQHNRIYTRHERKHGRGYISSIWKWQFRCLLDLCSHELAQWELAIGELIGAAGFITAVVAGSMALVREFRVGKKTFVRDVHFFIVAASWACWL